MSQSCLPLACTTPPLPLPYHPTLLLLLEPCLHLYSMAIMLAYGQPATVSQQAHTENTERYIPLTLYC